MDRPGHILAAVGQLPQDDPVLQRAAEIARTHQARLTVVHVVEVFTGFELAASDLGLIQQQIQLLARESVELAVARQAVDIADIDIRIEAGSPSLRLIELINEMGVDLVVMRAHQGDSLLKKIIGSTTDRVIRASHAPVLVVKRPVAQSYQGVVVATDTAEDCAAMGAFIAALLPSAGLHLIHVVYVPPQFEAVMLDAGSGQAAIEAHRHALIHKAKAYLRDMAKSLDPRPLASATKVLVGDPAKSLIRMTRSPKVDLIVLGPGNTGRMRRALLGSVSRRLLRNAACDVLIHRRVNATIE